MNKTGKRLLKGIACLSLASILGLATACGTAAASQSPTIGDNGNWFVDGVDTGVPATGPAGPQGEKGPQGDPGKDATTPGGDTTTPYFEDIVETEYQTKGTHSGNLEAKGKFYTDYQTRNDLWNAAQDLHIRMTEEGQVLLKNENSALPLTAGQKNITMFGVASVSPSIGGVGSGATRQKTVSGTDAKGYDWLTGFQAEGFRINPKVTTLYQDYIKTFTKVTAGDYINPPISKFTGSITSTYKGYSDAAVVVLSRIGAENEDLKTNSVNGHAKEDDHYLQLQDNEVDLIKHVKQYFGKVIVVINSSNVMQIPELAEEKTLNNLGVDAIIWAGGIGNAGSLATARIINGTVNPSGHTVSVWEKDMTKAPYWNNFAMNTQAKDENGNRLNSFFYDPDGEKTEYVTVEYREGIYSDYRYYETGYDDYNKEQAGKGTKWYDEQIAYPFGYGLSYTSFAWRLAGIAKNRSISSEKQTITMKVEVTNTGKVAGKDVVQLYYAAPYTAGGIEKASANLGDFAKTKLLQPGESEIVTLQIVAQDMASFDWDDSNDNGFIGYELEKGAYTISARRNSHDVVISEEFTLDRNINCTTDYISGNEITAVFTNEGYTNYETVRDDLLDNMIHRNEGMHQPAAPTVEDRTLTEDEYAILEASDYYYPYMDEAGQEYYVSQVPTSWTQGAETDITLTDLVGKNYEEATIDENGVATAATDADSKLWEEYMNSLTYDEMQGWLKTGASGSNGPVQLSGGMCWQTGPVTAATFNKELVREQGRIYANEGIWQNLKSWYGNGCDIHRTPFSGRNFEYYSADPFLSGEMASIVVEECTAKGIICMSKHFFANDQEYARNAFGGVATFATEQTLREISAKPFQMVVEKGNSLSLMTSFNRIGWITNSANYAVHQRLLRDEWGFTGFTCTDAWSKDHWSLDLTYRAGDDAYMSGTAGGSTGFTKGTWDASLRGGKGNVKVYTENAPTSDTLENSTHYYAVRKSAQRILFAYANSNNQKNYASSLELTVNLIWGEANTAVITSPQTADLSVALGKDAELPEGLTLNGATVSYAQPKGGDWLAEGEYKIPVTVTCDTWVTNVSSTLTVRVVNPITVNGKYIAGDETFKAKKGETLTFASEYYGYYTEHSSGRVMHWFHDEEHGDFVQHGDKFECYSYDVTEDTEKHLANFSVTGLPTGASAKDIVVSFTNGKGGSAYDIETGITVSGLNTAGTYEITVSYNVPFVGWFGSGWYRLPGKDYVVTKTFKIVVE